MSEEVYGPKEGQHIPAATLHRYLTDFANHFGITERTVFQTKVTAIEATEDGQWIIHTSSPIDEDDVRTKKVIVATDLTSTPNIPTYPGEEIFKPPFFHAKDFCTRADTVKSCKVATVVGAGKSAFDCAYVFAKEGQAQVDLIIRPTGQGPVWLCPPYVTPLKKKDGRAARHTLTHVVQSLSVAKRRWFFSRARVSPQNRYRSLPHGSVLEHLERRCGRGALL
jgi:cation diffusion facilitator CzcD-associated flavoprotein CzcO